MRRSRPDHGPPPAASDGGLGIAAPRGLCDVRRFSHEAMATVFEVHSVHADARYAAQAAQAAFDLADRLETQLSRFLPNSDVARINRLEAGDTTRVGDATMECLVIARHVFDLTRGAFDVSIGTGLPSLELYADDGVVRAATGDVRIDLGGIGKGYAVDLMAELLEEWGIERALIHGGFSSVIALEGPADRDVWPLTLSDPASPSTVLASLSARQKALSASGLRKGDHIVDPRTGRPVRSRRAAWAAVPRPKPAGGGALTADRPRIAPAAVADALTTAFMLLRPTDIESLCQRNPGLEAWILPSAAGGPQDRPRLRHFGEPLSGSPTA